MNSLKEASRQAKPWYSGRGIGWEQALAKPAQELVVANINELMEKLGKRNSQLARHCEVAQSTVSNWRNGVYSPEVANLSRIAGFLGVSVARLFRDPSDPKSVGMDVDTALAVLTESLKSIKKTDS